MKKEQWCEALNNREYPFTLTKDEQKQLKEDGLIVVCGQSDDIMAFYGAIYDEVEAYDGGTAYVTEEGWLTNQCPDSDCPYFEARKTNAIRITQVWMADESNTTWSYETTLPHSTFNVMEDGEVYCRAIIFSLADV